LKILYIHFHFSPPEGTGNDRSLEFCTEWSQQGEEVEVLCAYGRKGSKEINGFKVTSLGVKYSHFMPAWRRSSTFFFFFWKAIWYLLKTPKTDLIYASSTPLSVGLLALITKKIRNIPYFFETVDLWPEVPIQLSVTGYQLPVIRLKLVRKLLYWIEKLIYKNASTIVTLSEGMTESIIDKGISNDKVLTIHNGSNTEKFKPCHDKAAAKIKLGFNPDDIIVIYAGTIGIANGCEAIIHAAKQIQDSGLKNVKFIMLGNGSRRVEIEKLNSQFSILNSQSIDRVPKAEVHQYFDAADVGLVTFAPFKILETNSANKFFDYLASGLPVCINYEGWQKAYLNKYECGLSSPMKDDLAFAKQIEVLCQSKELRIKMGESSRQLAVKYFDRKILAGELIKRIKKRA
jgi:glycosyltransferase involved in cell wall biosynthesis